MDFEKKRWISLVAGVIIEILVGAVYAWSVFTMPLSEKFGWSLSQLSLAYTINTVSGMLSSMFLVPKIRKRLNIRDCILLGSLLYGGGNILAGFVDNLYLFYIVHPVITGIGNSLIYPALISYAMELFPEKTGFSGGMMAAGYGFGSVIWAVVVTNLFAVTGDISRVFVILGVMFLVCIALLSHLIYIIPADFTEKFQAIVQKKAKEKGTVVSLSEKPRGQMVKDPIFYIAYISLLASIICGTMVISQGSPIMQSKFAMSAQAAAVVVSAFSISNTLGRPVWGVISDRIGRTTSLIFLNILMGVSMVVLFLVDVQIVYVLALMLCTMCYGGVASLVAPVTGDLFGTKYITENYGITFSVYGIAGIIGAPLIAFIKEASGGYEGSFLFGFVLCVIGLIFSLLISSKYRKATSEHAGADTKAV